MTDDLFGMQGDPLDPKCKHGIWMCSRPDEPTRVSFCQQCTDQQTIRSVSVDQLLNDFAALTHRIRNTRDAHGIGPESELFRRQNLNDLREQRNLIKAEIIRRTEQVK